MGGSSHSLLSLESPPDNAPLAAAAVRGDGLCLKAAAVTSSCSFCVGLDLHFAPFIERIIPRRTTNCLGNFNFYGVDIFSFKTLRNKRAMAL